DARQAFLVDASLGKNARRLRVAGPERDSHVGAPAEVHRERRAPRARAEDRDRSGHADRAPVSGVTSFVMTCALAEFRLGTLRAPQSAAGSETEDLGDPDEPRLAVAMLDAHP